MQQKQRILAAAAFAMTGSNVEVTLGSMVPNDSRQDGATVWISNVSGVPVQVRGPDGTVGLSIPDGQAHQMFNHALEDGLLYLNGASGNVNVVIYGAVNSI